MSLLLTEYFRLVRLLEGDTEDDQHVIRQILHIMIPYLRSRLDVKDCVNRLFAKQVLNQSDKEEIECMLAQKGSTVATEIFLHKVSRRSASWNVEFAEVLREHGLEETASLLCQKGPDEHVHTISTL